MDTNLIIVGSILFVSLILQYIAAAIAFSLVELTDRQKAWLMIALAILLMALRRTVSFASLFIADVREHSNVYAELIALATSFLLVLGLAKIGHLFSNIQQSRKSLELEREKLEVINSELETFSYSVSHDLKSPLRHINGYADIVVEECRDKITPTGMEYLEKIKTHSQKLDTLIGNLLRLSQASRGALNPDTINLSELIKNILEELQEQEPDREVKTKIAPGVIVEADPDLIQNVLENLFRNAWKFTRKTEKPEIEFGVTKQSGNPVYYIKDNGIGFNPNLASKVFLPFERLHSDPDFEGNGIGLATVARIIRRHGGRVWADGSPGKGATFFFTLG